MLKVNLAGEGYRIEEVEDGDQVLPFVNEHEVDLIILDMKMARMDGLSTLSNLLQAGVYCSGDCPYRLLLGGECRGGDEKRCL